MSAGTLARNLQPFSAASGWQQSSARSPRCRAPSSRRARAPSSRLDFGKVEHVVDQPKQMLCSSAFHPMAFEACRHLSTKSIEHHFVKAEYGVQGRPQLVAHAGEELRLVVAGDLELLAFFSDLAEQLAFWIASADCVANVLRRSTTSGANGPGVFRCTARAPTICSSCMSGTASSALRPVRMIRSRNWLL